MKHLLTVRIMHDPEAKRTFTYARFGSEEEEIGIEVFDVKVRTPQGSILQVSRTLADLKKYGPNHKVTP